MCVSLHVSRMHVFSLVNHFHIEFYIKIKRQRILNLLNHSKRAGQCCVCVHLMLMFLDRGCCCGLLVPPPFTSYSTGLHMNPWWLSPLCSLPAKSKSSCLCRPHSYFPALLCTEWKVTCVGYIWLHIWPYEVLSGPSSFEYFILILHYCLPVVILLLCYKGDGRHAFGFTFQMSRVVTGSGNYRLLHSANESKILTFTVNRHS